LATLENQRIRLSKSLATKAATGLYRFFGAPGGDDRSRTGDPLLAKQVLSQLSYIPLSYISKVAILVGLPGVEPGTSRLSSARSSQLS
jgi:hypothetical protein